MTKIAIIGAGLSGLSVAHLLKDHAQVTLFEKARGVGGRMSTRRAEPYTFDHGTQYFTARTQPFQDFIQPLIDQGVIERWNAHYVKCEGNKIVERKNWIDEEPRYVGVPTINKVAKYLARGLNTYVNTRITSLEHQGRWQLNDDKGQQYRHFDWVISTVPAPQATELMPESFKHLTEIQAVKMRACFSLMLGFKQSIPVQFDVAHVANSDVSWIAVNSHKPGRAHPFSLIIHSSENYAEAHINDERQNVMQHLIHRASQIIGYNVGIADYKTVHRWRYANTAKQGKNTTVFLDLENRLAACGDWCLGGRVEGAFAAAYTLANQIKRNAL